MSRSQVAVNNYLASSHRPWFRNLATLNDSEILDYLKAYQKNLIFTKTNWRSDAAEVANNFIKRMISQP